jgi:TonB family protein
MSRQDTAADRSLAGFLVRCAAHKAPPGLAARLQEEWLADLAARRGALAQLRFGLGCCWATRVIARDFGSAAAAAGGAAAGQRLLAAYGGNELHRFSRRTTAMIAIVCFHAGVFYIYLNDFSRPAAVEPVSPAHVTFISKQRPAPAPTLLPRPRMTATTVDLPKQQCLFDLPADAHVITVLPAPATPASVPRAVPPPMTLLVGGPGAGFPDTGNYYPAAARRLDETGAAAVRVCVGPDGRLTADPTIVQTSRYALLDQGALRLARAGSGHYRPSTENGRPVAACYAFRVRFRLDEAE